MPVEQTHTKHAALITGCSSGIGLAAALALAREGYCVWAGVRRKESLEELLAMRDDPEQVPAASRDNFRPLVLDVTLPESVSAAIEEIRRSEIPLRLVVNNAGYGQFGALEDVTEEEFRRQWEVNVAGLWRVARLALPLLRASAPGSSIINISSILGRVAFPFGGPYAAGKFAVEALSDSLRQEVACWGIRVVVIEPGPIATQFNKNAMAAVNFQRFTQSPYAAVYKTLEAYYTRENRWGELPPEVVAKLIVRVASARRPRTRYLVTFPAKLLAAIRWIMPDRFLDWMVGSYLGLGKPPRC